MDAISTEFSLTKHDDYEGMRWWYDGNFFLDLFFSNFHLTYLNLMIRIIVE